MNLINCWTSELLLNVFQYRCERFGSGLRRASFLSQYALDVPFDGEQVTLRS